MKTVIFGCGIIAHRITNGFKQVKGNQLVGFASTNIERAKQYAQKYNVALYGDYDYFLNMDDIDAVYIATYNINHYELIEKCLKHHKHVICEKPMLSSIEETEALFDLASKNNCLLMEAMKACFLPINIKVKQMLKDHVIGDVKYMEASFVRGETFDKTHWLFDLKTGGSLKDIGSYCAGILNFMADKTPETLHTSTDKTNELADMNAQVSIKYDDVMAHVVVSHTVNGDSALRIYGTLGYIVIPEFWKASKGYYVVNSQRYELECELISDFHYEIQHFSDLVNNGITQSPIMSRQASIDILKITQNKDLY